LRALQRTGLGLLAAVEGLLGLWTLMFPESFYAHVPTVDLTPPFSEHLFRDFGGTTVGLAVVLTAAAISLERRLVVVALLAYLSFSSPHLVFHLGHLHGASGPAASVMVIVLAISVVLPLGLLVGVARPRPAPAAPSQAREHLRPRP